MCSLADSSMKESLDCRFVCHNDANLSRDGQINFVRLSPDLTPLHHSSTYHQFIVFFFFHILMPLKFVQDIFSSHPQDKPRPRMRRCATNATKLDRVTNRDVVGRFRESGSDISFMHGIQSYSPSSGQEYSKSQCSVLSPRISNA